MTKRYIDKQLRHSDMASVMSAG